jgi:hypothetical protein
MSSKVVFLKPWHLAADTIYYYETWHLAADTIYYYENDFFMRLIPIFKRIPTH